MMKQHDPVGFLLRGIWNANGRIFFDRENTNTLTGEEVRQFVESIIAGASISRGPKRKLWYPLTTEQKKQELLKAFPDEGKYELPVEETEDEV
jgi:hypothetical protein